MIGQVLWPPCEIVQRLVDINSEIVVHRRDDFSKMDRTVLGRLAVSTGGTDDLAHAHPATRKHRTRHEWPMVSSCGRVDARTTPEFALGNDGHIPVEAAFPQIFDKSGKSLVQKGRLLP